MWLGGMWNGMQLKPEKGQCVHWVANVLHSSEENSFYEEKVCMPW